MLIIPAIDIIGGQCVRLTKGDYSRSTIYSNNPVQVAKYFESQGATMIHVVDLDGAKYGNPINFETIKAIVKNVDCKVQVGGGIRNVQDIERYLEMGVSRVLLGTRAVESLQFVKEITERFGPEKIVIAVDVKDEKVMVKGWYESSKFEYLDFVIELLKVGVKQIVLTDVSRDGTLSEPNFEVMSEVGKTGMKVIASGGVCSLRDLALLKRVGVEGTIVGKALYEKKLNLRAAINESSSNLAKRVIPCLDVKNGRVVKGVNFLKMLELGDPVEVAKYYAQNGADEIVFLDISASSEERETMISVVSDVAQEVFIPLTVGGGIGSIDQIKKILRAGADKVSLNTAAIQNPALINQAAQIFGSQAIVVAVDVKEVNGIYKVFIRGGSVETELDLISWLTEAEKRGAGEILLTSIDRDGTGRGFDIELLRLVTESVNIPVIASGGAGSLEDFYSVFDCCNVDAVLAAGVFHRGELSVSEVKQFLFNQNLTIRI